MTLGVKYFNSDEAAKILGVNVSTIKRWTDSNKLECIKSAGGHRKFMVEHLKVFLEKNNKKLSRANLAFPGPADGLDINYYILKEDYSFLTGYLVKHSMKCDKPRIQQVLNGMYMGQVELYAIYDNLVAPALYKIGDMWEAGEINVLEEHLATQTIKDCVVRLQGIIPVPEETFATALCLNLSGELHDIALKMASNLLETKGFKVLYSGQLTPAINVTELLAKNAIDRVYISSSYIEDYETTQAELDEIIKASQQAGAQIFLGGEGFRRLHVNGAANVTMLNNFFDVCTL